MLKNVNVETLLKMDVTQLAKWIDDSYIKPLPLPKNTAEFARNNHLLGELANVYAFLSSLHAMAKIAVREAKKNKLPTDEINACIDRRDIIDEYIDIIKMQYNAYSRMITVQKNINDEMRMMGQQ